MAGIWVFAEGAEHTLELLCAGRKVAEQLGVKPVAFAPDEELARRYLGHGAREVFVLPGLAPDQGLEAYVPVLAQAAAQEEPDVILVGATQRGKEMAARLSARLDTGLCSNCTGFEVDAGSGRLVMERLMYGGAGVQRVVCTTRPQMATIAARAFEPAPAGEDDAKGTIRSLSAAPSSPVKVLHRTPAARGSVDVTEAKIVVCVGRGIEKKEDVKLARDLADALGGELACSRPVAEELRWLPEEVYLGISGKKIKPQLYVGVGVSGQIQHVTGIRDSRVILAINKDENAPIFEAADYGIVGDLYQVVPILIDELKKTLKH
ncbi:MAG TPA: electron transfer flavoprotein subunit alpha/FixB family protein [Syntrophobacter fumaroxidans]|nr:electron transfer flavoprotein subunit alpha/FixB family protein [Syntrophobacter fumaroxidans]